MILREVQIGLRGLEVGLRLLQLMIHFGRFDLGEEVARLHARADIGIPLLQIAVGARIDRRIDQRLRIPGQHQFLGRAGQFRMRDRHGEHGGLMRFDHQRLFRRYARRDAFVNKPADRAGGEQQQNDQAEAQAPALFVVDSFAVRSRAFGFRVHVPWFVIGEPVHNVGEPPACSGFLHEIVNKS